MKRKFCFRRVGWYSDRFEGIEVGALEAERQGRGTHALALRGGRSGRREVFLIARRTGVVANGAATLEMIIIVAARWSV